MVDINDYKNDFKMFCEKANNFVKEEKPEEAVKFLKKQKLLLKVCLNLMRINI